MLVCRSYFPKAIRSLIRFNLRKTLAKNDGTKMLLQTSALYKNEDKKNCVDEEDGNKKNKLDLTFNDAKEAYKSKTFAELIRGYTVFLLCSSSFLVERNEALMKTGKKILGEKLFNKLMKMTFFGHFVAGENDKELEPFLKNLENYCVKSILDFAAEEDISADEAIKREIESSKPKLIDEDKTKEEIGGKLTQYKPPTSTEQISDMREGVTSARTFFYENEKVCDKNAEIFINTIEKVACSEKRKFIAIKMTALGRPQLLYQLSEIIMRARAFVSDITGLKGSVIKQKLTVEELEKQLSNLGVEDTSKFVSQMEVDKNEEIMNLFPWNGIVNEHKKLEESFLIPSRSKKKMVRLISKLTDEENEMFENMLSRLNRIIEAAEEKEVFVMVDAEQSYFQPAIKRITTELMYIHNKEKAILMNTYQTYLKETYDEVISDLEEAARNDFCYGIKLVRGAYLIYERKRAEDMNYTDPTNPTYEATTQMYNDILDYCFKKIKNNIDNNDIEKLSLMIATHNEDTVRCVVELMDEYGVDPQDEIIFFGQLLGMCDYITFPLGMAGYHSYKYVPYGPINEVLPYLSRRVRENKDILAKLKKEKKVLLREMSRRIFAGEFLSKC